MLKRRYIAGLEVQGRSIRGRVLRYLDEATIQTGFGQKRERFARGAFGDVSALDVTLDLQHAPERRIARTRGGGLELRQSGDDILLEATLPATRDADDCLALVRSGVLRGFSVEFTAAAVSPAILHQIGRDLVLSGQSVLQFGVMPGGPTLRRPAEYDLVGSPDPATWAYRLRYIGPSRDSTAPGTVADVVHIRLNEDARAPHCGVSPILAAADTADGLAVVKSRSAAASAAAIDRQRARRYAIDRRLASSVFRRRFQDRLPAAQAFPIPREAPWRARAPVLPSG